VAGESEVLVNVRATTVTRSDAAYRAAKPFFSRYFTGLRRPKRRVLGTEFAGEVAEVGSGVTEFRVGDHVFGASIFGAHAEFVRVLERGAIGRMPSGMTFEEAAAASDGAILALNSMSPVTVGPGTKMLVVSRVASLPRLLFRQTLPTRVDASLRCRDVLTEAGRTSGTVSAPAPTTRSAH
jgi:NADPH:quinone reductase-like Zn-dependent oxidoreductase